jgi:hypothetical protein
MVLFTNEIYLLHNAEVLLEWLLSEYISCELVIVDTETL